jgi:hypothetical protein
MSQSIASAKRRRAGEQPPTPMNTRAVPNVASNQSIIPGSQPPMNGGLTLPQVIQLVDHRLIVLEKFMTTVNSSGLLATEDSSSASVVDASQPDSRPMNLRDAIEEFDKRYEMLAEEIVNLKNIVLSLQSYTMEVNKTLMEERVRIFSDLEENNSGSG